MKEKLIRYIYLFALALLLLSPVSVMADSSYTFEDANWSVKLTHLTQSEHTDPNFSLDFDMEHKIGGLFPTPYPEDGSHL